MPFKITAVVAREYTQTLPNDRLEPHEQDRVESAGEAARSVRRHLERRDPAGEVTLVEVDGAEVVGWCESCGVGLFLADDYLEDAEGVFLCQAHSPAADSLAAGGDPAS